MATIVTRSGKGSALTFVEADANFTNLNTDKIEYTDITIAAEATAANNGGLLWNNTNGELAYIPPTPAGIGAATSTQGALADSAMQDLTDDTTPQLSANLDVNNQSITNGITNGNIDLNANGTGKIRVGQGITHITTDADLNVDSNGEGMINLNGPVHIEDLTSFAETVDTLAGVSGTLSLDATDGPIKYVVPSGAMTINGFSTPISGQTITLLIDNATNSSNYGVTLGAGLLTPAGDGVTVTNSGYDLVTITCVDSVNGVYVVTSINDFQ